MKRVMASALLSVLAWSGCGSSDVPNTNGDCSGTVTANMQNYSSLPTTAATATTTKGCPAPGCVLTYFQATLVNTSGEVLISTPVEGTPPLVAPNVTVALGSAYTPGQYVVNLIAADGYTPASDPTQPGSITSVAYVGRISAGTTAADLMDVCPSLEITMAPPTSLDVCLDGCTAQLNCQTLSYSSFLACQAGPAVAGNNTSGCNANAAGLASEQTNWVNSMAAALAAKHPSMYANAAAAMGDATPLVQQAINAYEACNFQPCSMISSCQNTALAALTNPMPM